MLRRRMWHNEEGTALIHVTMELDACLRQRSGIGEYATELAKRLVEMPEIDFQGTAFNFRNRQNTAALDAMMKGRVHYNRLMPYGAYRRAWRALPVAYEQLFSCPSDIVHFSNYIVPPRVNGKVVSTVHDMTYMRYPETMQTENLAFLQKEMPRSMERVDVVTVISEFTRQEVVSLLKLPAERVCLVHCGVGEKVAPVPFAPLAQAKGITGPYILFLGTLEPRKNLIRLIQAFVRMRGDYAGPLQLVLAGGAGWKAEEILAAAEKVPDIVLTGFVSDSERSALYENAAAFVLPSLYEGFGIPVIEAMRDGVPVVCADAASLPEVAGGAALLVDPMDEVDIADALYKVVTDEALSAEMIKKGVENAKRFSWQDAARKLCDLYLEIAR